MVFSPPLFRVLILKNSILPRSLAYSDVNTPPSQKAAERPGFHQPRTVCHVLRTRETQLAPPGRAEEQKNRRYHQRP